MSTPLSEHDYNLITEYIDGQLSGEQRQAFETRLQAEPTLRAEYEALRDTVRLLQMADRVRVPRNFTLDPAVYGRPQHTSSWLDRLAALFGPTPLAVASGLLAGLLVFGGILVAGGAARGITLGVQSAAETTVETVVVAPEGDVAESMPAEESPNTMADDADMADDAESAEVAPTEGFEGMVQPPAGGGAGGAGDDETAEQDEVTIEETEGPTPAPTEEPTAETTGRLDIDGEPPRAPLSASGPIIGGIVAVMVGIVIFILVRRQVA